MLVLRPVPSQLRWLLVLMLYALAAAALIYSGAPLWLKLGLAPLVSLGLWREARIFGGRAEAVELRLTNTLAELRINGEVAASASPMVPHCSEWLTILEFPLDNAKPFQRRYSVVIFPDSLSSGELRRLRRWVFYGSV